MKELCAVIEAILFVSGDPVRVEDLAHSMNLTAMEMETALTELADHLSLESHGLQLNRSGGEVFLSIRPEFAPQIEAFLQPLEKRPLSQAVLETLSIIAYRQPVTKADIEQVRGVKCDYSVQALLAKGLIEEAGRRETLGRPSSTAPRTPFCGILAFPHWKNFHRWTSKRPRRRWKRKDNSGNTACRSCLVFQLCARYPMAMPPGLHTGHVATPLPVQSGHSSSMPD